MKLQRWMLILFGVALLPLCAMGSLAAFPDRPLRLIVGYPPGGATDLLSRIIARELTGKLGQPVTVENRPGADGSIAADFVAHSAPDGTTLIMITSNHTVPPVGYKLNYDPAKSFSPIIEAAYIPDVLVVTPSLPLHSLGDLVAYAKSHPAQLNFGSAGTGTAQFLDMEQFKQLTDTKLVNVSYKGGGPAVIALLGGEVQVSSTPVPAVIAQIRSGQLRALAISGDTRSPLLPDVPTFPEGLGKQGYEGSNNWYGIVAVAGTPNAIVKVLHDSISAVLNEPGPRKTLTDQGFTMISSTPEAFAQTIVSELDKWSTLAASVQAK